MHLKQISANPSNEKLTLYIVPYNVISEIGRVRKIENVYMPVRAFSLKKLTPEQNIYIPDKLSSSNFHCKGKPG